MQPVFTMRRLLFGPWRAIWHEPLARLYVCLVLPIGVVFLLTIPPMQMPDEMTHFLKSVAISRGDFVGIRLNTRDAGSSLPASVVRFAWSYDQWIGRAPQPYRLKTLLGNTSEGLGGPVLPAGYPNTVIYPPAFYLPQALGIVLARLCGFPAIVAYFASCLAVLLVSTFVGGWAIALAGRARLLLAMVLSLPMTLSLFVSCSQDAEQIAFTALAVALMVRWRERLSPGRAVVIALLLGLIVAAKPSYLPFILLSAVVADIGRWKMAAAMAIVSGMIVMACGFVFTRPAKVGFLPDNHVDAHAQALGILHHPLHFLKALQLTLDVTAGSLYRQCLGVLGRLNIDLSHFDYGFLTMAMTAASLLALWKARPFAAAPIDYLRRCGVLVLLAGSVVLCFVALYMIWTPVGHDGIDGVQGRYFLPVAVCATLLFPNSRAARTSMAEIGLFAFYLVAVGYMTEMKLLRFFWLV
ncbi:DUF2142 domain-containing protein [Brytella acorum]|uniref:DUF2142 domain-containing protein n=1 Tax=Brytella acorum TaxID=2959299 RepID=A0AA35UZ76_9PROT|nr:DUF2142 domain-containing protein [Brytella acorum]MDF3624348.1 DUF2142 domain-containing protein [Brytella acorum]CAI9119802.1 DUF2142 domain-containing protein [Brytella acorum]